MKRVRNFYGPENTRFHNNVCRLTQDYELRANPMNMSFQRPIGYDLTFDAREPWL